jgi:hypothetical protein
MVVPTPCGSENARWSPPASVTALFTLEWFRLQECWSTGQHTSLVDQDHPVAAASAGCAAPSASARLLVCQEILVLADGSTPAGLVAMDLFRLASTSWP